MITHQVFILFSFTEASIEGITFNFHELTYEASDNNENSSTVGKKRVREASKESQLGDGDDTKPKQKKMGALTTSRSHTSKKSSSNGPAEIDRKAYRNPESNSKEERDSDRIQNVLFVSRYGHTKPIYERDIEEIFRPYGSFQRVTMKGPIAFVDFVNAEDAARAKKELHQTPALNSDSIIVDFKKHGEGRSDKVRIHSSRISNIFFDHLLCTTECSLVSR